MIIFNTHWNCSGNFITIYRINPLSLVQIVIPAVNQMDGMFLTFIFMYIVLLVKFIISEYATVCSTDRRGRGLRFGVQVARESIEDERRSERGVRGNARHHPRHPVQLPISEGTSSAGCCSLLLLDHFVVRVVHSDLAETYSFLWALSNRLQKRVVWSFFSVEQLSIACVAPKIHAEATPWILEQHIYSTWIPLFWFCDSLLR